MSLRKLVGAVAAMCDGDDIMFASFDAECLGITVVHPTAREYFEGAVPEESIDGPFHYLMAAGALEGFNAQYSPCDRVVRFGFIGFVMEPDGDVVVIDTTDGHIYRLSHEVYTADGICDFGTGTTIPITRDGIIEHATPLAPTVAAFFQGWHDELLERKNKRDAFLAAAAADPNATDECGSTLLVYFISSQQLQKVRDELHRGARLDQVSGNGRTPLGEAVVFGHADIAGYLIACGANVNAANSRGTTPLMLAAQYSRLECMKLLVAAGADRNARDEWGRTAADLLCNIHGTEEMERLLRP